jgi:hypothetical protein
MAVGGRTVWAAAAVVGVAILAAGSAEGGGDACRQRAAAAASAASAAPKPTFDRFLFFATFEGLCEDSIPEAAVKAALEQDGSGHHVNFVYGCPVCQPVIEGFRAYALREKFQFNRKMPESFLLGGGEDDASKGFAARLVGADRADRGAALHGLVERWTERHMDRLRLTEEERAQWRQSFAEGRKKGMGFLPSSEGFGFKSCPSCDGAAGKDWLK